MKTIILSLMTMVCYMKGFSQTFIIADIQYQVTSINPNTVQIIKNPSSVITGDLIIPDTVTYNSIDYSVTSIASAAFYGNDITSITIPESVVFIGKSAFRDNHITKKTIPKGVTIDKKAFDNNHKLKPKTSKSKTIISSEMDYY